MELITFISAGIFWFYLSMPKKYFWKRELFNYSSKSDEYFYWEHLYAAIFGVLSAACYVIYEFIFGAVVWEVTLYFAICFCLLSTLLLTQRPKKDPLANSLKFVPYLMILGFHMDQVVFLKISWMTQGNALLVHLLLLFLGAVFWDYLFSARLIVKQYIQLLIFLLLLSSMAFWLFVYGMELMFYFLLHFSMLLVVFKIKYNKILGKRWLHEILLKPLALLCFYTVIQWLDYL